MGPKNSKIDEHKISESETDNDLTNIKCKVHGQTYYSFVTCVKLSSATSVLQIITCYIK